MTLMSSKYSCQKKYYEAIFFSYTCDCAKNFVGYTVSKWHNRISEVEKSRFVSIFQTLSRFCYNALPNLISQYTILHNRLYEKKWLRSIFFDRNILKILGNVH
jgi:hypothetical protein